MSDPCGRSARGSQALPHLAMHRPHPVRRQAGEHRLAHDDVPESIAELRALDHLGGERFVEQAVRRRLVTTARRDDVIGVERRSEHREPLQCRTRGRRDARNRVLVGVPFPLGIRRYTARAFLHGVRDAA